jgi:hypothetical protein
MFYLIRNPEEKKVDLPGNFTVEKIDEKPVFLKYLRPQDQIPVVAFDIPTVPADKPNPLPKHRIRINHSPCQLAHLKAHENAQRHRQLSW